jgi:hypothetical protein
MKKLLAALLIITFFFPSCRKCGEDIFLGDYELMSQSVQDWYPFQGVETLIFENLAGETIELVSSNRKEQFETITFRDICKGRRIDDVAREYYRAERFVVEYNGLGDDRTYFIKANLSVNRFAIEGNTDYFNLYDEINYSSSIQDYSSDDNQRITGDIKLVANPRDTQIQNDDIWHDGIAHHADQLTLNGNIFSDVWYYESDATPVLYVQKGSGIIAFLGFDDQIWVKK